MNKSIVVFGMVAVAAFAATATQFSKLSIISAAKERGAWERVKAWINASGYEDEWAACSYLSDEYPQFAMITNALCTASVLTAEDVSFILTNAQDTAIADAWLKRVYDGDMKTRTGRMKWHGKEKPSVDTNVVDGVTKIVKTCRYEDGYVHVEWSKTVTPLDAVKAQNAKLKSAALTNGVPLRLALARVKAARDAAKTNTVTVTVTAGGK